MRFLRTAVALVAAAFLSSCGLTPEQLRALSASAFAATDTAITVFGVSPTPPPATVRTLAPRTLSGWQLTQYDQGAILSLTATGFKVRLPTQGGHLNSIQRGRGATAPFKTLTIHYRIRVVSGSPVFRYVDHSSPDGLPPNVRPSIRTGFLQNRYWPAGAQCIVLRTTPDAYYSIRLKRELWQDVNGRPNPSGFYPTLQSSGLWVLSFGGGGNFEHGVYTTGGVAAFDLLGWSVQ